MTLSEKTVPVSVNHILGLVHSAEDYGYTTLYPDFAAMVGTVDDEQIKSYISNDLPSSEGYTQEDWDSALETLTEWHNKYCTKEEK